jgi:hypothetical protein
MGIYDMPKSNPNGKIKSVLSLTIYFLHRKNTFLFRKYFEQTEFYLCLQFLSNSTTQ